MKNPTHQKQSLRTAKTKSSLLSKNKLGPEKNALKHGATSSDFLTINERDRFDQLVRELSAHYAATSPLVPIQIERIARLTIQLERIQNLIDVLYFQSRDDKKPTKKLTDESLMQAATRIKFSIGLLEPKILDKIRLLFLKENLKLLFNESESVEEDKEEISLEKEVSDIPTIMQSTLLGAYLYTEAAFYQQKIDAYIEDKLQAIHHSSKGKRNYAEINIEVLSMAIDRRASKDNHRGIQARDYYEYHSLKQWFQTQLSAVPEYIERIQKSLEEKKVEIPNLPNFENLDRLMRYQTTISRQLSSAIGELLVLVR
ncbi:MULTISPECIES: hypothetical protein [unclassified Polynucleobacter]|uniref:hypothetical protein n=1 Tax=unclassified Polynucleobacter TaxID=2640945 RepID=UPI002572BC7C|nr:MULTISPECIES: hypothetical protein [unclassified Polynucleobacter]BEI41399.1 hypothetical protein PHIN9_13300 [Polynucleobacter sp. HIN9]BEI43156.1 hypothetical protein PHIN10_13050 [Polynucleobacter sp. HIN10]BEI44933.1 hypothetical protein PHIN11_13050 [Polynucleobacter sp. HIN11]